MIGGSVTTPLPSGTILAVLRAACFEYDPEKAKQEIHCPLHEDESPSAFVDPKRNVFYCSVCTPDGGWPAKRLAEEIGLPWERVLVDVGVREGVLGPPPKLKIVQRASEPASPEFGPEEAQDAWRVFRARALDDKRFVEDHAALEYLQSRGLLAAWDTAVVGIVPDDSRLPGTTATWRERGYAIAAPLYDGTGALCNVQGRAIGGQKPKSQFPKGSRAKGAVFATESGLRLLRGEDTGGPVALLAEGMTDYLALALTTAVPVLSAPGTGTFADAVGSWARGRTVWIAPDTDDAGQAVVEGAARRLYGVGAREVRRLSWPGKAKDACDVIAELGLEPLAQFLDREIGGHG